MNNAFELEGKTVMEKASLQAQQILPAPPAEGQDAKALYEEATSELGETPDWLWQSTGLFRSYVQPLVVATAIPFGLIGVIAGARLLDYSFSVYMMYATMGLIGVVVNDSLVMVHFINRARGAGMPLLEAVRQSGARRLRPILLTTLTTAIALLPMALGLHGGSRSFGPFASTFSFGLIAAMVGTLFVVPLCYTLLIRFQDGMGRRWSALRGRVPSWSPLPADPAHAPRRAHGS